MKNLLTSTPASGGYSLYEIYLMYFLPFGEMLTDIERRGFKIDRTLLAEMDAKSLSDSAQLVDEFRVWAATFSPEARTMNVDSDKQKQALFFTPVKNNKTGEVLDREQQFDVWLSALFLPPWTLHTHS